MPSRSESALHRSKLLLLLLLLGSLFLRSWSGGSSSFAFFLFLGDHFRSGRRRFGLSGYRFFLNYRRNDGKCRQIGLHLGRYSLRELNVANVDGIANVPLRT